MADRRPVTSQDVRDAQARLDGATEALKATVSPEQDPLVEAVLDAYSAWKNTSDLHIMDELDRRFPGLAPGLSEFIEEETFRNLL